MPAKYERCLAIGSIKKGTIYYKSKKEEGEGEVPVRYARRLARLDVFHNSPYIHEIVQPFHPQYPHQQGLGQDQDGPRKYCDAC